MEKWGSIKRRHVAISKLCPQVGSQYFLTPPTEAAAVETLQNQFSGYGSTAQVVARCLDRLELKQPLEHWEDRTIERVVSVFVDEKFPTVIALNKIDHPDADKVHILLASSCLRRTD